MLCFLGSSSPLGFNLYCGAGDPPITSALNGRPMSARDCQCRAQASTIMQYCIEYRHARANTRGVYARARERLAAVVHVDISMAFGERP